MFISKRVLSIGLEKAGFYKRIHKMAFEPLVSNNLLIQVGKGGGQVYINKAEIRDFGFIICDVQCYFVG